MRTWLIGCASAAWLGCGGDGASASSFGSGGMSTGDRSDASTVSSAQTSDWASSTTNDADATSSSTRASSSSTSDPLEPALCEAIDVSLVLDRQAPIFGIEPRRAVANFLDDLTEQTRARIRVFPNAGAPIPPAWSCNLDEDGPAQGLTFEWGRDGQPRATARPKLDCVYDGVRHYDGDGDEDGDHMFTGLLFPLLEHDDWPTPERSIALSMMLAQRDDDEANMYARPGLAADAFLRLAADSDRDRALSFTAGSNADELHAFSLAVSEQSLHLDWDDASLDEALQAYLPTVVQACADAEAPTIPQPPGGCERIDILFVIDGSLSMAQEQDALRGVNGPPVLRDFTDALALRLDTLQDLHIGVISSEPDDVVLHTHRDQPMLEPSPQTDCGLPDPWIVSPSDTLEQDFACLAATAAQSTLETTSRNAGEALADPANAGFLRDDAVLFVVMLTDEDTLGLGATRVQEHRLLLEAVGGDLSRIVVLAIAGTPGVFEAPQTTCFGAYGTASPGRRLDAIVRTFRERGVTSNICEGDLAASFDAALDDLVDACISFVPEG